MICDRPEIEGPEIGYCLWAPDCDATPLLAAKSDSGQAVTLTATNRAPYAYVYE